MRDRAGVSAILGRDCDRLASLDAQRRSAQAGAVVGLWAVGAIVRPFLNTMLTSGNGHLRARHGLPIDEHIAKHAADRCILTWRQAAAARFRQWDKRRRWI